MTDDSDREALKAKHFYPNDVTKTACPSDEDGAPTCMGDGYCGYSKELDSQICVNLPTD
ncbi:hypothetical protein ABZ341_18390 [Streptomyces sp. NPDC006173]|uniref:hypothetical protein n=1 Tax=Streptomyces sp. NPDC006173 TaxID=3155349 RepID=UPI0033D96D02